MFEGEGGGSNRCWQEGHGSVGRRRPRQAGQVQYVVLSLLATGVAYSRTHFIHRLAVDPACSPSQRRHDGRE